MRYRTKRKMLDKPAALDFVRSAAGGIPLPRGDTGAGSPSTVGRTVSPTAWHNCALESSQSRPPKLTQQHREIDVGLAGWPRGAPPWLAVRHREVDVGHWPRGAPTQRKRHPERSPELAWGEPVEPLEGRSEPARRNSTIRAGGGPAGDDQILPARLEDSIRSGGRTCETVLRMTESLGSGPPWLVVQHREVDVGMAEWPGISPPIGYDRAREWICHVRGDCWCRSVLRTGNRNRLRNKSSTTRSCTGDAEHEFSRTRSPGWYPMQSFRDPRDPQLLLMRTTSARAGGVDSDSESDSTGDALYEAFS